MGTALDPPAPISFNDASFETGSPLGDDESVHDYRLIQCGKKIIAGLIVIGRKCFTNADC